MLLESAVEAICVDEERGNTKAPADDDMAALDAEVVDELPLCSLRPDEDGPVWVN